LKDRVSNVEKDNACVTSGGSDMPMPYRTMIVDVLPHQPREAVPA
jgi:hypothetical protein